MGLQKINWKQINTTDVPTGQTVDIGSTLTPIDDIYAKDLYIDDLTVSGNTTFNSNVIINDTLTVSGETTLVDDVTVDGNLTVNDDAEFTTNVIIQGDLTVNGTEVIVNVETLSIKDAIITLNSAATGQTAPFMVDSGIEILRNSGTTAVLLWNEATQTWTAGVTGETYGIVLTSGATFSGDVIIQEDLTVTGDTTIVGDLTVIGDVNIDFAEHKTYTELYDEVTGSTLTQGKCYLLTDYRDDEMGEFIEPLILFALTNDSLSTMGKSTLYPSHIIYYDITDLTTEYLKGKIFRRKYDNDFADTIIIDY